MPATEKSRDQANQIRLSVLLALKEIGGSGRFSAIKACTKLWDKQLSQGLKDAQKLGEVRAQKIWVNGSRPMSLYSLTGKRLLAISHDIPVLDMKEPRIVQQTIRRYRGAGGTRTSRMRKAATPSD